MGQPININSTTSRDIEANISPYEETPAARIMYNIPFTGRCLDNTLIGETAKLFAVFHVGDAWYTKLHCDIMPNRPHTVFKVKRIPVITSITDGVFPSQIGYCQCLSSAV